MKRNNDQPGKAAWTIDEYMVATTLCRASVNNLISNEIVRSAKLGSRRLILTPPDELLSVAAERRLEITHRGSPETASRQQGRGRPRKYPRPPEGDPKDPATEPGTDAAAGRVRRRRTDGRA